MKIVEEYDGRLPIYHVLNKEEELIKSFDSFEEAQNYVINLNSTPCGEENPC